MKTVFVIHESISESLIKDLITLLMLIILSIGFQEFAPGETILQVAAIVAILGVSIHAALGKPIATREEAIREINKVYDKA